MGTTTAKTLMGRRPAASARIERILEQQPAAGAAPAAETVTRAVLFTDIVGSTAYFEQRGDEAGLAMVERHNRLLFPQVHAHGGRVVKTIGDAIMASYPTAGQAVESAVAMQCTLKEHNAAQPEAERIRVRIGIHFGPVLRRDEDLFGDVVNAAARVESLARGGQVLLAAAVREQLPADFEHECSLFDAVRVHGKAEPLEIYEVRWDPEAVSAPIAARTQFEPGTLLGGRFEILSQLGEGGMGQVYEARDRALDEVVALKFVRADLAADPQTLERFKGEVKLARSVTHPNICRIHEFLEMEGRVFLSMERVRGRTLAELLAAGRPLAPERIEQLVAGVCQGLQAAHERSITHRDLKPANVMIEEATGRVVLMDFGIAQLASSGPSDEAGVVVGTPEYMAPEQVRGDPVGPAADIYALGVILYQALTGRPPFEAPTPVAVAIRQLTAAPPPILQRNPRAPAGLVAAAERCLAKDPPKRFPTARAVARAVTGEPAAGPGARPRRALWTLVGGALLIGGLGTGLGLWLLGRGPGGPAGRSWRSRVLVSSRAVESHPRFGPDGRSLAFLRDGDVWLKEPSGDPRRLTHGAGAVEAEGLGGLSWAADGKRLLFTARSAGGLQTLAVDTAGDPPERLLPEAAGTDLSPDGRRLAFSRPDAAGHRGIAISRADGTEPEVVLAGDDSRDFLQPRWSPDGERLALVIHRLGYDSTRDIAVLELASGALERLTRDGFGRKAHNADPTWTPDGRFIVYASKRQGNMSLFQVPARGGPSVPLTAGAIGGCRDPDLAPGAEAIAFCTREEQLDIDLLDLASGNGRVITQDIWPDRFPAFSPDGRAVAFRSQRSSEHPAQRSLILFDLDSGEERSLPGPPGLRDFAWCGPGWLAYAATVGQERLLGRIELSSGRSEVLVHGFYRLWSPACSPDGRRLVFVGMRTSRDARDLWLVEPGSTEPRKLSPRGGLHAYPTVSPDGRTVAYRWAPSGKRLGEAELRLLRLGTDHPRPRTVTADAAFRRSRRRLRFAPDGRSLYFMEAVGRDGRLFQIDIQGGPARPLRQVRRIHTFDFDLSPDAGQLVFPRANRLGDLYLLERGTGG